MTALSARLIADARQLGFAAAATVELKEAQHFSRYQAWIARGWHSEMDYLERGAVGRSDPRHLLPGAKSALVAALNVRIPPWPTGLSPHVSAYARSADYHRVAGLLLGSLAERAQEYPAGPARFVACVDTAPLLERELAWRAGLGWIGRNTCLITPGVGSFTVLATLLTTFELPGDQTGESRCGSCRRCIDACPTGALDADLGIDARRCLSYLTIEHRGLIPTEFHPYLGETLFGCDRCQQVCPWNNGGPDADLPELRPQNWPAAEQLLPMTSAVFRRWFRGTALDRARRDGLTRNLLIHLNVHRHPQLPRLLDLLRDDPSPVIAGTVQQILEAR